MDVLENALHQLRSQDTRPMGDRCSAARHGAADVDALGHRPDDQRRAAARLVVDALAVLAACGGLASDVSGAVADVLDAAGTRPSVAVPTGRRNYPASVHDTVDEPDPHLGPARPGVYPPGPEGDREAFRDLEYTLDD